MKELEKLETDEILEYDMEIEFFGKPNQRFLIEKMKKRCIAAEKLELALGAQVMLIANLDLEKGLANGSRGVIVRFEEEIPLVKFMNGLTRYISYHSWDIEENEKKLMSFSQIPLKLAWALSFHKAQGIQLDCVEIDLDDVFEHGQAYVALSRVKTLQGLSIVSMDVNRITAHPTALQFYSDLEK